jgi:hypothetical protein
MRSGWAATTDTQIAITNEIDAALDLQAAFSGLIVLNNITVS